MSKNKKEIQEIDLLTDSLTDSKAEDTQLDVKSDEEYIPKSLLKNKPKRVLSEAQKESLSKGRAKAIAYKKSQLEKRKEMELEKRRQLEEEMIAYKKKLEDDYIKKAIRLKKKHIIREKELEELSDDDTPMEQIKEKLEKVKPQKQPIREAPDSNFQKVEKPKYIFI